jgi:hypothetical protein
VWPQIEKENPSKMKLIKSLSILATGGIFAGTALAGPGDAYLGSHAPSVAKASAEKENEYVTIALFRPGVKSPGAKRRVNARSSADNRWGRMIKSATSRHRVGAANLCRQSMPDFLLSEPSNY